MTPTNITTKPQEERLNMSVIPDVVMREQPEHLRDYFLQRLRHYREQGASLPKPSDPRYIEMSAQNEKK